MIIQSSAKVILLLSLVFQAIPTTDEPPQTRVMVVGDIMMHKPITNSGYDSNSKAYQFESIFTEVKPIFSNADLVIGNLETPLAGIDAGYSGYPRFNAPKELAEALEHIGFGVLTTANNHSMDKGEKGVVQTLNHLDEYNLLHTGTFRTEEERKMPLIVDTNGMKIGLIAYTYGTNGIPIPKDKPYMVNLLDRASIQEDIKILKEKKVDYIMAMVHYGTEYQRFPNSQQKEWTAALKEMGVDFVLGSHPHVVQPLQISKEDGKESDTGVIYSLGNFLSNQSGNWKDYGIILNLLLEKDVKNHRVILKEVSIIPTYVLRYQDQGKRKYKIIPLEEEYMNINYHDEYIFQYGQELIEHVMKGLD